MRKVVLYIAMSLDGYITDKQGGVEWLIGDGSDKDNQGSYSRFMKTIDTVILGYKTYHQIVTELSPDDWVYKGKKSFVITHNNFKSSDEIIFTDKKPDDLIAELRNRDGKDIWICGGASIVNQLIDSNLIDKFYITMIPIILGSGISLFTKHDKELQLRLNSIENYNGMVGLIYERRQ